MADGEEDIVDEVIKYYRPNSLFRNFEVKGGARPRPAPRPRAAVARSRGALARPTDHPHSSQARTGRSST